MDILRHLKLKIATAFGIDDDKLSEKYRAI